MSAHQPAEWAQSTTAPGGSSARQAVRPCGWEGVLELPNGLGVGDQVVLEFRCEEQHEGPREVGVVSCQMDAAASGHGQVRLLRSQNCKQIESSVASVRPSGLRAKAHCPEDVNR